MAAPPVTGFGTVLGAFGVRAAGVVNGVMPSRVLSMGDSHGDERTSNDMMNSPSPPCIGYVNAVFGWPRFARICE